MTAGPDGRPGGGSSCPQPSVVLTVGKLDGVHAGHRHLLARVLAEADARHAKSCAVVLHPDPASVLRGAPMALLTTLEERARRIRALGIGIVEPLHFTREVSELGPEAFLHRVTERFRIAAIVVGPDFAFGRDRAGDLAALERLGRKVGFDVVVVPPLEATGEWVSSRRLRALIAAGDVATARALMRHPPRVIGSVVHGAGRGRVLGFPTANLDPSADFALPANGIYTVRVSWNGACHDGVASVGVRPTFDNGARLVEVHLLDYDDDLYGREIAVDFLSRQREERRFETVDALVAQMHRDVEGARARLAFEAGLGAVQSPDGRQLRVRALDLADACDRLAAAMPPSLGIAVPPVDRRRHCVTLHADGEPPLLSTWLQALSSMESAATSIPEPLSASRRIGAHVYHAGSRVLHAIVTARDVPAPTPSAPRWSLHAFERTAHGIDAVARAGA